MDGPYTLITNAKSGKRDPALIDRLRDQLIESLGEIEHVVVDSGEAIIKAAKAAREKGGGVVFAAGGDGTLSAVANALKGSDVSMAAVPMGTFNFFARGLGTPEDPVEAAKALCQGEVIDYDIGEVNGEVFLNNISLGLYPAILRARESVYKTWGRSRIAAYWSVLKTLSRPGHGMRLRVTTDGTAHDLVTPMVFIGSNPFQLEMMNLDGAELPRAGQLALYYGPATGRFGMLRTAFWLAFHQAKKDREFKMLSGREIIIEVPRRKVTVALDGERLRTSPPVEVRLVAGALKVVVPRTSSAATAA